MSRLYIEARLQAIKEITNASCFDDKDCENIIGFCDEIASAVPDIDKVVEQLEEERNSVLLYDTYDNEVVNHYLYIIDDLIEIVKRGGKE